MAQPHDDPRPLGGYAALLALYGAGVSAAFVGLRSRKDRVRLPSARELVVLALATQRLSRIISKDSVMAPLRKPFTRFEEPAGEGESNEEVVGSGPRHAIGELITCPFCIAQWSATALVAGWVAVPSATTAAVTVLSVVQLNDFLQLGLAALRNQQ